MLPPQMTTYPKSSMKKPETPPPPRIQLPDPDSVMGMSDFVAKPSLLQQMRTAVGYDVPQAARINK